MQKMLSHARKGPVENLPEYNSVMRMIKNYTKNKQFIRRFEDELLVINTKYFGTNSSSVIGSPNGSQSIPIHTSASIGQEKLDELNNKYLKRYQVAREDVSYVEVLLTRLPTEVKDMIIHTYFKKLYVDELAAKHNCTRATIYNRINAAIKHDCDLLI